MVDTSDSEDEPTKDIRGKVESERTAAGEALPHWRTTHNKHCLSEDESDTSGKYALSAVYHYLLPSLVNFFKT
jgi:hypothetical protein